MSSACFACCLFELDQFRSQRLRAFHESGQHVYLATGSFYQRNKTKKKKNSNSHRLCMLCMDKFRSQRLGAFHESGQHVYLATGFDFREKRSCWLWVDRRPDFAVGLLHSHTMKERRRRLFSLKSRVKKQLAAR